VCAETLGLEVVFNLKIMLYSELVMLNLMSICMWIGMCRDQMLTIWVKWAYAKKKKIWIKCLLYDYFDVSITQE